MTFIQKLLCVAGVTFASLGHAHGADAVIKRGYVENRYGQLHYQMAVPTESKAKQRTPLVMFHQTANTSLEFGKSASVGFLNNGWLSSVLWRMPSFSASNKTGCVTIGARSRNLAA